MPRSPGHALRLKLAVLAISAAASMTIAEFAARLFLPASAKLVEDERNLAYAHDRELGWFPIAGTERFVTGSRRYHVRHNSLGFRDRELGAKSSPRIVFFGDSFVWGYDVEEKDRFTERLREALPSFEVVNAGVSGYGTDQEFLLLQRVFESLAPDSVVLVFSDNDRADNTLNQVYNGYYKPFFVADGQNLVLRGVPVPYSRNYYAVRAPALMEIRLVRSLVEFYADWTLPPLRKVPDLTHLIVREMRNYLRSRGCTLDVGLTRRDERLERFLSEERIGWVDLETPLRFPALGYHWTPDGHAEVAQRITAYLRRSFDPRSGGTLSLRPPHRTPLTDRCTRNPATAVHRQG
jgi:hypothetical protein